MSIIPPKPEIDFTDELITSKGGLTFLAQFASQLGLPEQAGLKKRLTWW